MSQIKKGALLNYTTIFLTNVVGLFITPFILNHIGKAEYGIYTAIGALVGTISVLDLGLNNTIVRFVAKYKAEKDRKGEENFLATTMLIYGAISLTVVLIGVLFYGHIDTYFTKMNAEELRIAKTIFILLICNLAIGLPGGSFTGICYGYEVFVFPKTVNIIRYILRTITVVAVLTLGGKAIALVVIDTVFNVLFLIVEIYFVFFHLKVRFKLHEFKLKYVKQIFGYSLWIFVFALVSMFQWKAGHWILGSIALPEVLTIYGIGIVLGTYYGSFSTAISSVFLPRATKMTVGNATGEELTSMMIKIGRISFIVLMYIFGAFLLFGNQFVYLWVGKELGVEGSHETWLIALLIMIAYTLPLVQGFGNSILEAKNKLSFKAILYLSFLFLGVVLGAFLAKTYGALGMITGTVTGWFIVQNVMNFYYHKVIGLNIIRFFKELFHKTILMVIIIISLGYLINLIPGAGWISFAVKAICYSVMYALLMYNFGLINFEKELFKSSIAPVLKKFKL
ncbi:Polysaccharide biosynthesis protein [Mariniflexile rhizosphaerae]|uniref:lipopolysaccharide biosynthesis protein n=1 Tax=unclassified Mariniflexile TaxID=2643887 RepID=UPI000CB62490|nr:oligosaccharide flippase family protein [Mariniflexile sp. TRM1-10]AXP82469.1 Polysaccharide biosynthesis protein [Mariniflexile sp. TRM1-10]PLB18411.1 MAG: Polysaccharide biosynthesis protein [Flavobacteriaceae bacterium FS1-H7996/R]